MNEYLAINTSFPDEDGDFSPGLEFTNASQDTLLLSDYLLSHEYPDDLTFELPSVNIPPNGIFLAWLSGKAKAGHTTFAWPDPKDPVFLIEKSTMKVVDSIQAFNYNANESICRSPDFEEEKYFATQIGLVSLGKRNVSPGPWRKVQTYAGFTPGDSAPRGCLVYDDKMWIFDYETVDSSFNWTPIVEVWNSEDGINWTLVNAYPPFTHMSMFVVFNGYMWAFNGYAYRSKDGIYWEKVSSDTPYWGKMTVFKNRLWAVQGSYIYSSADGITWRNMRKVPWVYRPDPVLLEHEGWLYVIGGAINYGTPYEFYWQDVWRSPDGENWELVLYQAPWEGNLWPVAASFDKKIWLMGGASSYRPENGGNTNAIWYSEDGKEWSQLKVDNVWSPRHAQFIWQFPNAIWIAAGYEGGGAVGLFSDVWKFTKLRRPLSARIRSNQMTESHGVDSQTNQVASLDLTYGDKPFKIDIESELPTSTRITNSSVLAIEGDSISVQNAGVSTITVSQESSPVFYSQRVTYNITIGKKDLVASVPDYERLFFEENPEFNIVYAGFVNNDGVPDIDELPTLSVTADKFTHVGKYPITLTGGLDANYNLILDSGELTIKKDKAALPLVFPNPATNHINILYENNICKIALALTDVSGAVIISADLDPETHRHSLDIQNVPPGLYLLHIVDGFLQNRTIKVMIY